jgi:hypothetical protein
MKLGEFFKPSFYNPETGEQFIEVRCMSYAFILMALARWVVPMLPGAKDPLLIEMSHLVDVVASLVLVVSTLVNVIRSPVLPVLVCVVLLLGSGMSLALGQGQAGQALIADAGLSVILVLLHVLVNNLYRRFKPAAF